MGAILLIGPSGSGKSSFISKLSGQKVPIGNDLDSCTMDVNKYHIRYGDFDLFLVDTPGFNNTNMRKFGGDDDIIKDISRWLKKEQLQEEAIEGVIYFLKIFNNRFNKKLLRKHLNLVRTVYNSSFSPRVVVVTTFWDKEGTSEYTKQEKAHKEIRSEILKSDILRIKDKDNLQQAQRVLDFVLRMPFEPDPIDDFSKESDASAPHGSIWSRVLRSK